MEKQTHTPGPWVARVQTGTSPDPKTGRHWSGFTIRDGAGDFCICASPNYPQGDTQNEANARLIAAAPELLAALRDAVQNLDNNPLASEHARARVEKVRSAALAAIARATEQKG